MTAETNSSEHAWQKCNVSVTLDVIGGRWKAVIIFLLLNGPKRFNEMQRYIHGISHKVLAEELKDLESSEIVLRTEHGGAAPAVEYSLTEFGASLEPVLLGMREWGERNREKLQGMAESAAH